MSTTNSNTKEKTEETQETGGCPFAGREGYSTRRTRMEYLQVHPEIQDIDESLNANPDTTQPLYYWQIYSLWGQTPFMDICTDFYNSIYDNVVDEGDRLFKAVFERAAPKSHHIRAQAAYWIDSMGGGRLYMGGTDRLNFHHQINAEPIMNENGAKRWIRHMKIAFWNNHHLHFSGANADPRILPCLVDFLKTKMMSYATLHGWEFDTTDFNVQDFCPPSSSPQAAAAEKGIGESSTTTTKTTLEVIDESS
eukprot:scaffold7479_cov61-Cylindrotheca_fusiformis.AAC.1